MPGRYKWDPTARGGSCAFIEVCRGRGHTTVKLLWSGGKPVCPSSVRTATVYLTDRTVDFLISFDTVVASLVFMDGENYLFRHWGSYSACTSRHISKWLDENEYSTPWVYRVCSPINPLFVLKGEMLPEAKTLRPLYKLIKE